MKSLKFVGSSLEDLRNFPAEARRLAGFELDALPRGLDPSDWKPMKETIVESSGNVFADLGFDPAEAAILQMRSRLMNDLRGYIESNQLTQVEAAARLGIAQSRVSDLIRGKWEKFSLEMLITLEARLGRKVTLELAA